jgi:tetratricopeptide (TPR) repeat protein
MELRVRTAGLLDLRNPNILGGYLMFSIPVALGLALAEQDVRLRLLFWGGFFLNAFTLVASFTRGAWVGGAVAVVTVAFIATRHGARLLKTDAIPAAAAGVFAAVLLFVQSRIEYFDRILPIVQSGATRLAETEGGGSGRIMIWQAAVSAVRDRPVLGHGSDSFRFVFPRFKPAEYVRVSENVADSPHNYPLQLAVGSGVLGALLFYAAMGWAALRSTPLVFRRTDDPRRIVYGAFWAAAAGYIASLLFGLSLPGVSFLLWMAVAVLLAPTASVTTLRAPAWGMPVAYALLAILLIGALLQAPVLRADNAYLHAVRPDAGSAAPVAAAEAVRLNPLNHSYREHLGFSHLNEAIRQLSEAEKAAATGRSPVTYLQAAERSLSAGERTMKETIDWNPDDYSTHEYLASLYNLRGDLLGDTADFTRAIEIAERGRVLDPYAVAIRAEQAYALRALGRPDEAIVLLRGSLEILPGHARTALLLAATYEEQGAPDPALEVLREADAANPEQKALEDAIDLIESGGSLLGEQ